MGLKQRTVEELETSAQAFKDVGLKPGQEVPGSETAKIVLLLCEEWRTMRTILEEALRDATHSDRCPVDSGTAYAVDVVVPCTCWVAKAEALLGVSGGRVPTDI